MHLVMLSASHLVSKLWLWYWSSQPVSRKRFILLFAYSTTKHLRLAIGKASSKRFNQPAAGMLSVNVTQGYQNHQLSGSILICRTSPVSCHRHTTALQLRQNCKMRKSIKGCNRKKISAVLHQLKLESIIVPNVFVFWEKLKEKGKKESHGCKLDFFSE